MSNPEKLDLSTEFEVCRVTDNSSENKRLRIATEVPFSIKAGDTELAGLMSSPSRLKELTYGFLFTSGFIQKASDVLSFSLNETQWTATVTLKDDPAPEKIE